MRQRGARKRLVGSVVSNKMDKTASILVERLTQHPVYKKYVKKRTRYMADDPENQCRIGDKVRIVETRPLSKHKRWRVTQIVEKSQAEQ